MKLQHKKLVAKWLRRLLDWADDRLHAWEVRLRGVPVPVCLESAGDEKPAVDAVFCPYPFPQEKLGTRAVSRRVPSDRESLRAGEARQNGSPAETKRFSEIMGDALTLDTAKDRLMQATQADALLEIAAQLAELNERQRAAAVIMRADGQISFAEWFGLWDLTKDPEVKRLCEIAWNAGSICEREPR